MVGMQTDLAPLLDRITMLADERATATPQRLLERIEHTLTDGYAHALTLEAEALRLEREIEHALAEVDAERPPAGLGALAERLGAVRREALLLRDRLASLKRRAEIVRRSPAAA